MAREKEGYRENLEILNTRFPDHDMLNMSEVMQITGYGDRRSMIQNIGAKHWAGKRISKVYLANWMCGGR